ncbi:ribonuclease P protein component 3 [Methanothermococcus okinawensis]|uniref:Ribonuclease P protein component 3 n=1 Tax=Methanothermococcus okinawensis (strain DSM 14208 / JCM 11175 / IH1) TaxID=647113 RepID=F8ALG5_METOI|nr:RNase P subunit p30 family protein [Methanothermococcus okinawensis]AEH06557.1 Ribonuclease P protein component 3 [Methanothermococcus okinawensis IH1]
MITKPVDINHIFDEEGIELIKELGWYGSVFIQYHNEYDNEKLKCAKEYGEKYGLKIYSGIKISSKSSKEMLKTVKKYRDKVDMVLVEGGIIKISRKALEMHDVDILSTPELNRRDNGIDHILARLGSTHRVAIELNFKSLLEKKYYERARIIWAFRRNLSLAKKYNTPVVISSSAKDIYDIKSPNDLKSFLNTITMDANYSKAIMEMSYKIAEYRTYLRSSNVVRYGVEIVEDSNKELK